MSQLTFFEIQSSSAQTFPERRQIGYGRARLWLGITTVGTIVTVASLGLIFKTSGFFERFTESFRLGPEFSLLVFVLSYAIIHLPFDIVGGYILPKHFKRSHPPLADFLVGLLRGVAGHTLILFVTAIAINLAGRWGGLPLTIATSSVIVLLLLLGRLTFASLIAQLNFRDSAANFAGNQTALPIAYVKNRDEAFTGGVTGVFRPIGHIVPAKWYEMLNPEELDFAIKRRTISIETGSWRRGRVAAIVFTLTGLTIACYLVGKNRLGTVGGTIDLSFWFTLWSFIGLLSLPTLNRRSVSAIDNLARVDGTTFDVLISATRRLDELLDGEQQRPGIVETIFHPIPSVENRIRGQSTHLRTSCWDVARTTVYVSLSGMGLLSRAVHCNCGRPSLWVFLPVD